MGPRRPPRGASVPTAERDAAILAVTGTASPITAQVRRDAQAWFNRTLEPLLRSERGYSPDPATAWEQWLAARAAAVGARGALSPDEGLWLASAWWRAVVYFRARGRRGTTPPASIPRALAAKINRHIDQAHERAVDALTATGQAAAASAISDDLVAVIGLVAANSKATRGAPKQIASAAVPRFIRRVCAHLPGLSLRVARELAWRAGRAAGCALTIGAIEHPTRRL